MLLKNLDIKQNNRKIWTKPSKISYIKNKIKNKKAPNFKNWFVKKKKKTKKKYLFSTHDVLGKCKKDIFDYIQGMVTNV